MRTRWGLLLAAWLLAGCAIGTVTPVTAATPQPSQIAATPSASVAVLGVKVGPKPAPKPRPKATPTVRQRPRPVYQAPVPRYTPPPTNVCYINQPCDVSKLKWTITYGCTKFWLQSQRAIDPDAHCPPGWPYIP